MSPFTASAELYDLHKRMVGLLVYSVQTSFVASPRRLLSMAYAYDVLSAHQLGIVTFTGALVDGDIVRAMESLFLDDRWVPGYSAVWDLSNVQLLVLEPGDVTAIYQKVVELREQIDGGRSAIVARRELDRSIAVMVSHQLKKRPERNTEVFRTLADAEHWLEVDAHLDQVVADLRVSF